MEIMGKCCLGGGQENDGSVGSSDKSKMLDITRDKPIKVAVRVVVPVRDHPKFNFVGKLLGPKGNSMKRLQEDTMCKMAVLGRGSVKDRKKEEELRLSGDPRYTHLFEDLHVEISTFAAPAEAHARIAYALAEVRRFLVPDYHDDIRQEQMWEMQALSTSQNQNLDTNNSHNGGCTTPSDENGHGSETDSLNTTTDGSTNGCHGHAGIGMNGGTTGGLLCSSSSIIPNVVADTESTILNNNTHLVYEMTSGVNGLTGMGHMPIDMHGNAIHIKHARLPPPPPPPSVQQVTSQTNNGNTVVTLQNDVDASETVYLDANGGILHPALRGIKAVNIGGSLTRKRPLLGVPRSSMNPTKRTVMTLLARAKNAQALHGLRTRNGGVISTTMDQPLHHMISSPLILQ